MINSVVLQGRLCFEVKVKDGKTPYLQNRIAVRNSADETVFIDIKVFGKQAEVMEEHCKKGSMIGIVGRLSSYTNDDDETFLSVVANSIELMDFKKDDEDEKPRKKKRSSRDDDNEEERPRKKSKRRVDDDDEEEDEVPRRRKKRRVEDDDDDEEDY